MADPEGGEAKRDIEFGDVTGLLWRKLREMRTAFQLLAIIAIAALACTVIPQNLMPEEYQARYGKFLGNVLIRLGLSHIHSVWWFLLLLGALMLSLAACSGRLWQQAVSRWRVPVSAAPGAGSLTAATAGEAQTLLPRVELLTRRHGYRTSALPGEGQRQVLYLTKNRFSAWGQALTHYAIFLIAIGAVLGSLPGVSLDDMAPIDEGQTYQGKLPFKLFVKSFRIEHDPATGAIENYYTVGSVVREGQEDMPVTISVNHPLKYRGYLLSQSSYGLGSVVVQVTRNGKPEALRFPLVQFEDEQGQAVWKPDEENAAQYLASGTEAIMARDASLEDEEPAVNLIFVSGLPRKGSGGGMSRHDIKNLGWVRQGQTVKIPGGSIEFMSVTMQTVLGVRRDVGLPLVWGGFIASILGMMMIFYFPLQRRLLSLEPGTAGETLLRVRDLGRAGTDDPLWAALLKELPAKPVAGKENHVA